MGFSKSSLKPSGQAKIVTGYYRYTDIWFAWPDVLSPEHGRAIKAAFAHDALVDLEHPLREAGVTGVSMFMGTLDASGESRLMFSSAQVDYMRYWLHAVGVTAEEIPLPYSDCLILKTALRNVSPVVYKTGGDLKKAVKNIAKINKKLKGTNPELLGRRDAFERTRACYAAKQGTWLAIDIEAWDRDHTAVTELGFSFRHWENGAPVDEQGHLRVKEYTSYRNTYVKSYPEDFHFGTSQILSKSAFKTEIADLIKRTSGNGPLFLVFHDANGDIKYLRSPAIGLALTNLIYMLPDTCPDIGIYVVDTAELFGALMGEGTNKFSLQSMCNQLQIRVEHLHNAGNDAHATMLALLTMASGDPLDAQKESRWPSQTPGAGVSLKRELPRHEEEDDYSDEEGIFPPVRGYDPLTGKLLAGPPEMFENADDL